jgi:hypothetical protein
VASSYATPGPCQPPLPCIEGLFKHNTSVFLGGCTEAINFSPKFHLQLEPPPWHMSRSFCSVAGGDGGAGSGWGAADVRP